MNNLQDCQKILGYNYNDLLYLEKALTHRSYLNENKTIKESNERLEYLGDAVLELITSEFLYHTFPNLPEGKLTNLRSKIVQTRTLAAAAIKLNLGKYLMLSKGEADGGGANNKSLLADLFEAIIGSIFLDGGLESSKFFVKKHLLNDYQNLIDQAKVEDWKSKLQEIVQSKGGNAPIYEVIKEEGPDHARIFTVQVNFFDKPQSTGTGKSKQSAQQDAARGAVKKFETINKN